MSVERVKQYGDILKVFCKPTKKFPEGRNYFYCDLEDIDLVKAYTWFLHKADRNIYVLAHSKYINCYREDLSFHRELANKYLGYYPDYIDHINGVDIDNIDSNLNIVTSQQNQFNKPVRGYQFRYNSGFELRICYNQKSFKPYGVVHTEIEACILQHELEIKYLKELMQDDYYMYNFLLDRRQDLDILDLERTRKISPEKAVYRHVVRYAKDNAWYYYRYGLENYFKQHRISVPDYDLDDQGFMVDKITRKKLCPFN